MRLDGVGDDVLVDLGANDVLVGLVDLDDLLDLREMSLANRSLIVVTVILGSSEDLRAIVVLGVEHAHESEPRGAVEVARVEEHRRERTRP